MPRIRLFFDSSALFSGACSERGAARALLKLAEGETITVVVSEQVLLETEQALARKAPGGLVSLRNTLSSARVEVRADPDATEIQRHHDLISHGADITIVVAAMHANVDYLITHNRRHFIGDPDVATRSGLRIGTPGDALAWFVGWSRGEADRRGRE